MKLMFPPIGNDVPGVIEALTLLITDDLKWPLAGLIKSASRNN